MHADALQITPALGTSFNTGAGSVTVAIPPLANGDLPKYVAVVADGRFHIAFGVTGVTCNNADGALMDFMVPADQVVVFNVAGCTHFAHRQELGGGVDAMVYPLDNGGGAATAAGTP